MLVEIGIGKEDVRMVAPVLIQSSRSSGNTDTAIYYLPESVFIGSSYMSLRNYAVKLPYAAVRHAFEQAARLNAPVVDLTEKNLENIRKSYERSLRKVSQPGPVTPAKPLL